MSFFISTLLAGAVAFADGATEPSDQTGNRASLQVSENPKTENIDKTDRADKTDNTDWWGATWDDQSFKILMIGGVSAGLTSTADVSLRDQWGNHQLMTNDSSRWGDFLGTGIPGATIALGQLIWDRQNGVSHAKTLVATTLWTGGLKFITNRKRPGNNNHYNAFPSGHTSTMFATATSLTYSYGWMVGAPAFLLAGFTGLSRVADDVHWTSDIVAGAFIGIWLGRAYHHSVKAEISQPENPQKSSRLMIVPSVQRDEYFVQVLYDF